MSNTVKAIIIDDEPNARTMLQGMLHEFLPDVEVVADCPNLPAGVKAIKKYSPDLVFLDIEMPGHSGLELLDFFNDEEITFDIIFTTAYDNYAVKAFKLSAIDYLLKPIELAELENAVARYRRNQKKHNVEYSVLKENLQQNLSKKMAVPIGNAIKLIQTDHILYLKADSSYTEIHLNTGEKIVVSRTLKNFEGSMPDTGAFFRCHKSYIVNLHQVTDYVKADGGYLILNNNMQIPIVPYKVNEFLGIFRMIKR